MQEILKRANAKALKVAVRRKALDIMKAELQEGLKSIITRQKLIKVANCLEYRWMTVDEYGNDPLASDSEDEKCLVKVEKSA